MTSQRQTSVIDRWLTFDPTKWGQIILKAVAEGRGACGFKVGRILSASGSRVTALTHARMVTQTSFIQIGMSKSILCTHTFLLYTPTHTLYIHWTHTQYIIFCKKKYVLGRMWACDTGGEQLRVWLEKTENTVCWWQELLVTVGEHVVGQARTPDACPLHVVCPVGQWWDPAIHTHHHCTTWPPHWQLLWQHYYWR